VSRPLGRFQFAHNVALIDQLFTEGEEFAAPGVLADHVGYSSVFLIGGLAASLGLRMVLSARTTSLPHDKRFTVE
jgi:hypothetical protein